MAAVLKTSRGLTAPRGFESHALRPLQQTAGRAPGAGCGTWPELIKRYPPADRRSPRQGSTDPVPGAPTADVGAVGGVALPDVVVQPECERLELRPLGQGGEPGDQEAADGLPPGPWSGGRVGDLEPATVVVATDQRHDARVADGGGQGRFGADPAAQALPGRPGTVGEMPLQQRGIRGQGSQGQAVGTGRGDRRADSARTTQRLTATPLPAGTLGQP